jgi:ATP-dependent Clp protease ATP-binding subunit ClpC
MTMRSEELLEAAGKVATEWNHHWLGTEHVLVAYLEAERQAKVKPFLTDAGLKFDAAEANVRESVPPRDEREAGAHDGYVSTPRIQKIRGFAHGVAFVAAWPDTPAVTAEHLMLGLLVDGQGVGAEAIRKEGVNIDNVIIHMGNRLASS